MSVSVGDLLRLPHLNLRLHSGGRGLDRAVSWTHTSDLPDPWHWVAEGQLLMTNGMSFPRKAAEQVEWAEKLDLAGVSALAIGAEMFCPPLTAQFTRRSEVLGLPVLWINYPMPFLAISQTVAEATMLEQSQRLMRTARIYDTIRRSAGATWSVADEISAVLGCTIEVCDRRTGAAYHPDGPPVTPEVREAVGGAGSGEPRAGGRSVITAHGTEVLVLDVPTHDEAVLAVRRGDGGPLDGVLLQHAATVVALGLSHTHLVLENSRREGAELTAQLVDGRADPRLATAQLDAVGIETRTAIVACATGQKARLLQLHVSLWQRRVSHVVAIRGNVAHVVLPDADEAVAALSEAIAPLGRLGVSRPLQSVPRSVQAAREARWALGIAHDTDQPMVRYGSASSGSVLRHVDDAEALLQRWVAPLLQYDEDHDADLVVTLETFLDHQRSWRRTAEALNVHRQTVLYRIRKIEELTGAQVNETGDLAQLWLGVQARKWLRE
ncbi:PucR family transcriptional regulator [Calidifontibacter terrae]